MKHQLLVWLLLLGNIYPLLSQSTQMQFVASVNKVNQSTSGIDWLVTDSSRYWYYPNGNYDLREIYCYDTINQKYFLCTKIDNYQSPDTSITTFYDRSTATSTFEQAYCSFTRTDSQGRTLESGGCYNPNGDNWGYYRNYYVLDTLNRIKQSRYASWSPNFQRLVTSVVTDFFYDTLGYERYQYVQSNNGGSYYLSYTSWDSIDPVTNTNYFTEIARNSPTAPWDTSRHIVSYKDTVAGIITSITINKGKNMAGVFGNIYRDSTVFDQINYTSDQHRFTWNDTVQQWQQTNRHYLERDSNGYTLHSESYYALYTGAPLGLSYESTYLRDSMGRATYQLSRSYDYLTGALGLNNEREWEYDVPVGDSTVNITISHNQDILNGVAETTKEETYFDSLSRRVDERYSIYDSTAQTWQPKNWGYYYYDENLLIGIEEHYTQSLNFSLSPNPATSTANVQFEAKRAMVGTLTMYNLSGQLVFEQAINVSAGAQQLPINLKVLNIPPGLYILKLSTPVSESMTKLVYQP